MINNRFTLKKLLGEGRSRVFISSDSENPGKDIALKILSKDVTDKEIDTFLSEYRILKKLNHQHIISAYENGTVLKIGNVEQNNYNIELGDKYIALELIKGCELSEYDGIKDEKTLIDITAQICSTLYYLHQSNYIYYDLKPDNILVETLNGKPSIVFIDFGLTKNIHLMNEVEVSGTAEYLAPEIIKKEGVDHRADLYSLGILLYKTVYDKFPFDVSNELEIYKAHLEKDFEYPKSRYSENLINVIKKLLSVNPEDRFNTSLQVLKELNIPITPEFSRSWICARTFSKRSEINEVVNKFIGSEDQGGVLTLRGLDGIGKTTLLEEINFEYEKSILLKNSSLHDKLSFVYYLYKSLIFNVSVRSSIDTFLIAEVEQLLEEPEEVLLSELKTTITKISQKGEFLLLIDDFNLCDEFIKEIFHQIIPILQSNNIKMILTEDSSKEFSTEAINNITIYNLTPMTDNELHDFISLSYYKDFPQDKIIELVAKYSDSRPGQVFDFINSLILTQILKYDYSGAIISDDEAELEKIISSQERVNEILCGQLKDEELICAQMISLFDIQVNEKALSVLLDKDMNEVYRTLLLLREKGLLYPSNISQTPLFTSARLKAYIYSKIVDVEKKHFEVAEKLLGADFNFSVLEIARQYETAKSYEKSYKLLPVEVKIELDVFMSKTFFQLGRFQECSDSIEELLKKELNDEDKFDLLLLKGQSQIKIGKIEEGRDLLTSYLPQIKDEENRLDIMIDIADAELYLNNFEASDKICKEVIGDKTAAHETIGRAYNLLGLVELYSANNLSKTIEHFLSAQSAFRKAKNLTRISSMALNLGNIYLMNGDFERAEENWKESIKINRNIGNLENEAHSHLNFGIYYYDKADYEKSVDSYKRAETIFGNLGYKYGMGLAQMNLGEVYIEMCEYQNSFEMLNSARNIFSGLKSYEEEGEVIFLLARLFFAIGDGDRLSAIADNYIRFSKNHNLDELQKEKLEFVEIIAGICCDNVKADLIRLEEFRSSLASAEERDSKFMFIRINFLLCEKLIQAEEYEKANSLLDNNIIEEYIKHNPHIHAVNQYYLGMIALKSNLPGLKPPLDYFTIALNLLEEIDITEITWKVLKEVATIYYERGQFPKAKANVTLARFLIEHILEKFTDPHLQKVFSSKLEVSISLNALNIIENKL